MYSNGEYTTTTQIVVLPGYRVPYMYVKIMRVLFEWDLGFYAFNVFIITNFNLFIFKSVSFRCELLRVLFII